MICRGGGIGIRGRLRACAHIGREGSSPSLGTESYKHINTEAYKQEI